MVRRKNIQNHRGGPVSKNSVKITLYANGFTVNDGPFRDYKDPANKSFMEQLRNSRIPKELQAQYKGDLDVALEDKT